MLKTPLFLRYSAGGRDSGSVLGRWRDWGLGTGDWVHFIRIPQSTIPNLYPLSPNFIALIISRLAAGNS